MKINTKLAVPVLLCGFALQAAAAEYSLEEVATKFNPLDQVSPAMLAGTHGGVEGEACANRPGDDPTGNFCQPEVRHCSEWDRADPRGFCFEAHFLTRTFPQVDPAVRPGGTRIDMTVYVPPAAKRPRHGSPLVIHSHGFGGSKAANLEVPGSIVAEQAAKQMWQEEGWFVISFSERGFGKSGRHMDSIGMLQPELEGLDANEIIDWAVKHLREGIEAFHFDPNNPAHISAAPGPESRFNEAACENLPQNNPGGGPVALGRPDACPPPSLLMGDDGKRMRDHDPDPAIGMLGYSYGGGFQYTATHTAQDLLGNQRIDAIIPQGTWFDLRYSLAQHDVPKTGWINILTAFAVEGSTLVGLENNEFRPLAPLIIQARAEADVLNRVRGETSLTFLRHSPVNYCDPVSGSATRGVDVFHIQGLQDTLFNFNDGYNNVICKARADRKNDVRFMMVTGGHVLPALSPANHSGNTGMSIDEVVWCGPDKRPEKALSLRELQVAFFREKLAGEKGAADIVPKVCIVQENLDPADPRIDPATGKLNHPDFNPEAGFEPAIANYNKHRFAGEGVRYDRLEDIRLGTGAGQHCGGVPCRFEFADVQVLMNAAGSAQFQPLYKNDSGAPQVIAGIPTLKLQLTDVPHPDPVLFVGIGIRRGAAGPFNPVTDHSGGVTDSIVGETYSHDIDDCQAAGNCFEGFGGSDSQDFRGQFRDGYPGSGQRGTNDVELLHAQLLAIRSTRYPFMARSGPMDSALEGEALGSLTTGEKIAHNRSQPLWFGCAPNTTSPDPLTPPPGCEMGRMVGVSSVIRPGDEVGLYFFGSHVQYATNSGRIPGPARVTGTVALPIFPR